MLAVPAPDRRRAGRGSKRGYSGARNPDADKVVDKVIPPKLESGDNGSCPPESALGGGDGSGKPRETFREH